MADDHAMPSRGATDATPDKITIVSSASKNINNKKINKNKQIFIIFFLFDFLINLIC